MLMASRTDIGRVRLVNEDRAYIQHQLNGFELAIIADGMGGHQAGDVASQMAIDFIARELQQISLSMTFDEREKLVLSAINTANGRIFQYASEREIYQGMGTTVVVALAAEDQLLLAHIGDSRAYRVRGNEITQLTIDHSLVNELVKSGQLTPEEAAHHPRRNVVTRALGTEATIEADIKTIQLDPEEIILLCSDGLSNMIESDDIVRIIHNGPNLEAAVDKLIHEALIAGGDDNITVVLMHNIDNAEWKRGDSE
ncbi:Stp1/IreP family PP2C-type Ser/Thr phosphatase [Paenibacillus sp. N1-5-1-14]|uniref:Stp1/IreP family PP2C-type Ser/Thr phosphatase n=1 Tax=Paenibacillus radicibacter TaxID=2972488 RepID=UPI002159535A|nr:Stp1/IreP family PP2C-type Ser/Thr phosphatase [Paenibacillus radicibacter]MCR8641709.1 Stp1/IreP family PP2C-type Ser/Thr phosphatase [Paenibacillus radicibacter]